MLTSTSGKSTVISNQTHTNQRPYPESSSTNNFKDRSSLQNTEEEGKGPRLATQFLTFFLAT